MESTKKIINWNGLEIGISTLKGDRRFPLSAPMRCDYGHVRKTWGYGKDGKSLDVYLAGDTPSVYKVYQLDQMKRLDEHKYILGAGSIDEAQQIYLLHAPPGLFGGIIEYSIEKLKLDGGLTEQPTINPLSVL